MEPSARVWQETGVAHLAETPSIARPSLADLCAARRAGHGLPRAFYQRPDVFEADLRLLESR